MVAVEFRNFCVKLLGRERFVPVHKSYFSGEWWERSLLH
jgi:hypothetical protein